jgi:hypothetical protein
MAAIIAQQRPRGGTQLRSPAIATPAVQCCVPALAGSALVVR